MSDMSKRSPREKMPRKKLLPSLLTFTLLAVSLLSAAEAVAQESSPVTPVNQPVAGGDGVVAPAAPETPVPSEPQAAPVEEPVAVAAEVVETPPTPSEPEEVVEKEVVVMQPVAAAPDKVEEKPAEPPKEEEKKWYDYISLSPSVAFRLPINLEAPPNLPPEVFFAVLKVHAQYGPFELFLEPSFRQTKNRKFYPSNVVLRQAYLKWNTPAEGLSLSGGILFNQFGFFWDGSFYGNNTVFVGRKLNSDYNLQLEWEKKFGESYDLHMWFQLSPAPDGTNITLFDWLSPPTDTARDFESDSNYKQALAARLRIMPKISFGDFYIIPGVSLEYMRALRLKLLPPGAPNTPKRDIAGKGGVFSGAVDLSLGWKKLRLTSEFVARTVDPGLTTKDHRVNRYHISTSLFAPVYFNPKADWFKVFIVTTGFSYSLYQTEKFNEMLYEVGLLTQVYEHVKARVEYGRYWTPAKPKSYAHTLELLLYVDF